MSNIDTSAEAIRELLQAYEGNSEFETDMVAMLDALAAEKEAMKRQEPLIYVDTGHLREMLNGNTTTIWASYEQDAQQRLTPLYTAPQPAAPSDAGALPEGWVPLTITFEEGYPEEVAYGPKVMMDRLKKWLDKFYELRLAAAPEAPQPSVRGPLRGIRAVLSAYGITGTQGGEAP